MVTWNAMNWNAMKELDRVRREINRAFDDAWLPNKGASRRFAFLPGHAARRYPLINLYEDSDNFQVEALAPGIDAENLKLSITNNILTISGEKVRNPEDIKREAYHRSERAAGRFTRTVEIPSQVNSDKISAEYKNGILYVSLPKAEEAKLKSIQVKVS